MTLWQAKRRAGGIPSGGAHSCVWNTHLGKKDKYTKAHSPATALCSQLIPSIHPPYGPTLAAKMKVETVQFDARFPHQNQTKACWQYFVDYHKVRACIMVRVAWAAQMVSPLRCKLLSC